MTEPQKIEIIRAVTNVQTAIETPLADISDLIREQNTLLQNLIDLLRVRD